MSTLTTAFATDEDVALRFAADFSLLCPPDQKVAAGTDGVFLAGQPWTLRSASVPFLDRGLQPRQVVRLQSGASPEETFVIQSVANDALILRRKGAAPGRGQPPAPPEGLSGVEFRVLTLGPQLLEASVGLSDRLGLSDLLATQSLVDSTIFALLRDAVVLTVGHRAYRDISRFPGDLFATKASQVQDELERLVDRLTHASERIDRVVRARTRISR